MSLLRTIGMIFLIFILYILSLGVTFQMNKIDYKTTLNTPQTLGIAIIFTAVLVIIILSSSTTKGEDFTYELGLDKACSSGSYMYTGNSELAKKCRKYLASDAGKEMTENSCTPGLYKFRNNKKNVRFNFSPESEGNWKTGRKCDEGLDFKERVGVD